MSQTGSNPANTTHPDWQSNNQVQYIKENPEPKLECLEERVLYSAVPMPVDLVEYVDVENSPELIDAFESSHQSIDLISAGLDGLSSDEHGQYDLDLSGSELESLDVGNSSVEIIFIDQSVSGYRQLVDDILNNSDVDVHYDIAFIDPTNNGLNQITNTLNEQANTDKRYDAVHLVTHGSDATLNLGNTQVNGSNLHGHAHEFVNWQSALTSDADILIYGCEVAESDLGRQFVSEISDLTGADVAASDDLTGHHDLGGDWRFEFVAGSIETDSVFSSQIEAGWQYTLAGEETTGESGTATGRNLAINDSQTIVQVFAQDLGDGDGLDVFYQITDANGVQDAVQVNTADSAGTQHWASVAIDNDGDFVVVWTDELDSGEQGVFAKYYGADGSLIRDEFRVDPIGSGGNDASVAMDADGNFIVVWEGSGVQDSDGIYGHRFDTTGASIGATFLVNDVANAGLNQGNADVAMNDSGQFVIAWDDFDGVDTESIVYARWFDSDGTPAGSTEETVDSDSGFWYFDASVDINNNGHFAVGYGLASDVFDADFHGVMEDSFVHTGAKAMTYSVSGTTVSVEQEIEPYDDKSGHQGAASVVVLNDDGLVLTWQGQGDANDGGGVVTDNNGVFYRNFDLFTGATSMPDGPAFIDASSVAGIQQSPIVAGNGTDFVFGFDNDGDALQLETSFNYAPISKNSTLPVASGFEYTLDLSDFSFFDLNKDQLDHVVLEAVPDPSLGQGQLLRNGVGLNSADSISRSEIENGEITYQPPPGLLGPVALIQYRTSDGTDTSASATIQIETEASASLIFSTRGAASLGDASWDGGDAILFGGNDFNLGTPTTGDIFAAFDTTLDIDAFHYVSTDTVLDTSPPTSLQTGDILFSVKGTTDQIAGMGTTNKSDILHFRPGARGDYDVNNGTFSLLATLAGDKDIQSLTLVEKDVVIGDVTVDRGSILFSDDGAKEDVQVLELSSGVATVQTLIDGNQVGIDRQINGLELVDVDMVVGGMALNEGTLLMSLSQIDEIGPADSVTTERQDIFAIDFATTTLGSGKAFGNANLLFDASSISGFSNDSKSDIDAVSMVAITSDEFIQINAGTSVDEGGTVTITNGELLTFDTDNSNTELVYKILSGPANGRITVSGVQAATFTQQDINDGVVVYHHDGSEFASDSFSFDVDDGVGTSSSAIFNIGVNPVNDRPVALNDNLGVIPNGVSTTILAADLIGNDTDAENDTLSIATVTRPANGTLVINSDGDLVFTPDAGFTGPQSFNYTVTDGDAFSSSATVNFVVNDVPVGTNDAYETVKETALVGDVSVNDVEGVHGAASYSIVEIVDNGTLTLNPDGSFTYTPDASFFGVDSFEYVINDGVDVSESTTVNISVLAPPVTGNDVVAVNFGEIVSPDVLFNDSDPDGNLKDVTIQIVSTVEYGTLKFEPGGTRLAYMATNPLAVSDQFEYQLLDGDGNLSSVAKVHIAIHHAPDNLSLDNNEINENSANGTVVGVVSATDLNDDIASFQLLDTDSSLLNNPFRIDPLTGEITVNNSLLLDYETTDSFEESVIVTDSSGLTTVKVFTIDVKPVDEAPQVAKIVRTLDEGSQIKGDVSLSTTDPEGNIDGYRLVSGPEHGALKFDSNGQWLYQHNDTENFADQFTFAVRDMAGNLTQSTVILNVSPIDDVPVAFGDDFSTDSITALEIKSSDLLANDENVKNNPVIEIVKAPGAGTLVQNVDGTITFTPDVSFDGVDFFEYRIQVDDQFSATTRVNLNVAGVAAQPVIVKEVVSTEPAVDDSSSNTVTKNVVEVVAEAEPVETVQQDPATEQNVTGPIAQDRDGVGSGGGESSESSQSDAVFGDAIRQEQVQFEVEKQNSRTLFWQPRHAIYGNQLIVNVAQNDLQSGSNLSITESLEDFTGMAIGLSNDFFNDLDQQELIGDLNFSDIPILGLSASSMFTVGYLVWAVRAGALVSTFISMPAWTQFDPLPVIEKGIPVNFAEDDDSLEKLVDTV